MQVPVESVIGIIETIDDNYNLTLVRIALKSANCHMLMSMMDDDGVREAIEVAIFQVVARVPMVQAIAKALNIDEKIMKQVAQFLTTQVKKEGIAVALVSMETAPSSLPPTLGDSSWLKDKWKPRQAKKNLRRR